MPKIWNRIKFSRDKVGGGIPVWIKPPKRRVVGALVLNELQEMEKISACSPLAYDGASHQAKFQKAWEVKSQSGDDVVLKATVRSPEIYPGMNIMICPDSITGTGTGVLVSKVVQDRETHTVTVTAAGLGTVAAGDAVVEAAAAGEDVQMYAVPSNGVYEVSLEDTLGGDINFVGIAQGNKYVYENNIAFIPQVIKDAIHDVQWEKFNQIN